MSEVPSMMEAAAILSQVLQPSTDADSTTTNSPAADGKTLPTNTKLLFATLTHLQNALLHDTDKSLSEQGQGVSPILTTAYNLTTGELLLTPIRKLLVECTTLLVTRCARVDVYGLIKDLCETASLTSRSPKSLNGSRLLSVETLGLLVSRPEVVRRVSSLVPDVAVALGKCSRSTDVNIRIGSYKAAGMICDAMVECSPESKFDSPFVAMQGVEEKEVRSSVGVLVRSAAARSEAMMLRSPLQHRMKTSLAAPNFARRSSAA